MLSSELHDLIKEREFISVATCDPHGNPNAAPKFLLRAEKNHIYLIDYTIGKTWENLQINPRISLSISDKETMKGYKINGVVEFIEEGDSFKRLGEEFNDKLLRLSVERVLEGVQTRRPHKTFEVGVPKKFVIFKVTIQEVVEIGPYGQLERKRAG